MSARWPDEPQYPRGLLAATAADYARYRPGYPSSFVEALLDAARPGRREWPDRFASMGLLVGQVSRFEDLAPDL